MRRRDILSVDSVICLALLFIVPFVYTRYGTVAFVTVPAVILMRILVQKILYDRHDELDTGGFRKRMLNIDPISFELFFWSAVVSVTITVWMISDIVSVTIIASMTILRAFLEYYWFSDRSDRWYSLRFTFYKLRRRMHPTYSERLQKILVSEVDGMKGHDFEHYVAELLTMNGFRKVKVTRGSGDFGVDVTAILDNDIYAIQCKRSEYKIGIKAVQEAFLGKEHYKADVAVVLTNNYFTKQAYEAADGKVVLWDRERLGTLVHKARDSVPDEQYNDEMKATEKEIRMFAALFDRGRGDARLTEKVMGTVYPAGSIRSKEDVDHFLRRVGEHLYEAYGVTEMRMRRIRHAVEKNRSITPYEADIICYHLSGAHTITIKEMKDVRSELAELFAGPE